MDGSESGTLQPEVAVCRAAVESSSIPATSSSAGCMLFLDARARYSGDGTDRSGCHPPSMHTVLAFANKRHRLPRPDETGLARRDYRVNATSLIAISPARRRLMDRWWTGTLCWAWPRRSAGANSGCCRPERQAAEDRPPPRGPQSTGSPPFRWLSGIPKRRIKATLGAERVEELGYA